MYSRIFKIKVSKLSNSGLYVRLYARGEERVDSYEKALLVELY